MICQHLRFRRLIAAVLTLLLTSAALAQNPFTQPLPGSTVASWMLDPSALGKTPESDPHRQVLEHAVLTLLSRTTSTGADVVAELGPLLDPVLVRDAPYRLILLDLAIECGPDHAPGTAARLTRFQAVLEIAVDRHEKFDAAIRRTLIADTEEAQEFDFARGRRGHMLRRGDPTGDRAWLWTDDSLLIGFGTDAITNLLNAPAEGSAWEDHSHRARVHRGDHRIFMESFVDLDRLRELIPDEVGWGILGNLLHAWSISNARSCMMHGWVLPAAADRPQLLQVDLTWSSRAEPRSAIRGASLTATRWHPGLGRAPSDAAYAVVFIPDWAEWLKTSVNTYQALSPGDATFAGRREEWFRRFAHPLNRIVAEFGGVLALIGHPDPIRAPSILIPRRPFQRGSLRQDFQTVLRSVSPPVRWDAQEGAWIVPIPTAATGQDWSIAWRLSPDALVGEWRSRMEATAPAPPDSAAPGR